MIRVEFTMTEEQAVEFIENIREALDNDESFEVNAKFGQEASKKLIRDTVAQMAFDEAETSIEEELVDAYKKRAEEHDPDDPWVNEYTAENRHLSDA